MPILYVDNFRGFQSTFVPLRDVNFFVGENSTGKSSILKLLGIMSSQGFWRYNIFGEAETVLGSFSEIITSGDKREHFEIGFIGPKQDDSDLVSAIKIKLIEKDGYPVPKEISYRDEVINLQITLEGFFLKYRYRLIDSGQKWSDDDKDFKNWITDNSLKDCPFQRLTMDVSSSLSILRQLQTVVMFEQSKGSSHEIAKRYEITIPYMLNRVAWFAPSVVEPEKVYNQVPLIFTPKGKHSASVLRDIIEGPDVKKILNRFGTDSGLFESISIKNLKNISEDAFEIQVSINKIKLNILNVGYGVSQILPLIIEAIARPDYTWLIYQQPETHLHPRAQAAVGEFIFKSNQADHQKFILETHSDYIIDRYRLRLHRASKQDRQYGSGQVVFFTRDNSGNHTHVIDINSDGTYSEFQPASFRDFFISEQLNLLKV
ncbi:AAA family ATPase [Mucilaginibacter segetis]|uniref:AAA family ATPase n=1 Tax=Mucilaginibacter segetis TaxID=2793071 RepID=A0A934PSA7_9SPHI|nr:AAA family ATPase [Mucilaginibacter segetis]MBK0378567.1 AAA family ATPase [Mucilaginibacter segetis]